MGHFTVPKAIKPKSLRTYFVPTFQRTTIYSILARKICLHIVRIRFSPSPPRRAPIWVPFLRDGEGEIRTFDETLAVREGEKSTAASGG